MKTMKKHVFFALLGLIPLIHSCSGGSCPAGDALLPATAFSEKLKGCPEAVLLDVRTPEEFAKGHLPNAVNVDWNGNDFDSKTVRLDKSKPLFVYCLSGGRSAAAAEKLRSDGFKSVIELEGGIMKWRASNLPESKGDPGKTAGMGQAAFDALLKTDHLVLIDFYADWCGPCKKMAPYLEEIKEDMSARVNVVRINADDNQFMVHVLGIDALPVLLIYKNGIPVWRNSGFVEKAEVVAKLEEHLNR